MKQIDGQLIRVDSLLKKAGSEFFGNKHKRDREWWVLGRTIGLLGRSGKSKYIFALETEPPLPDFQILDTDGTSLFCVEIAEAIEYGRRRNQEIKERLSNPLPFGRSIYVIDDPFVSFRKLIINKLSKPYAPGSWLIVFFSISKLQMPDCNEIPWSQMIFKEVNSWGNTDLSPDLKLCQFERIFVLDSGAKSLVSIFPNHEVITEEGNSFSS